MTVVMGAAAPTVWVSWAWGARDRHPKARPHLQMRKHVGQRVGVLLGVGTNDKGFWTTPPPPPPPHCILKHNWEEGTNVRTPLYIPAMDKTDNGAIT